MEGLGRCMYTCRYVLRLLHPHRSYTTIHVASLNLTLGTNADWHAVPVSWYK